VGYVREMNLLPFGELPVYKARRFVPAKANLGEWTEIEPLFDELERRGQHVKRVAELER